MVTILMSFIVSSTFSQVSNGFLRRQNTQLANDNGMIALRGVNLGNWLHIEPYMINAPSNIADSYENLFSAIENVTGSSFHAETFFNTWRSTFIQKKDIDTIASFGFNHVRVPFPYHLFYNTANNAYTNEGFQYLDSVVNWCKQKNIYAILDLHLAPGGQINGELWSNFNVNKQITKQIWKNIAEHYATETAVGGYDILNEPLISQQTEQWKLKDLYQAITNEIRSVDTNHLLIFEGNWYASSFWELTDGTPSDNDRWDDNMAFSQHVYWVPQPSSTNQWSSFVANGMSVPLWCGEGGENSNHWLNEWVVDCENTNSSWCLWTYKKAGGISSLFSNPYNINFQKVLDFWNGGLQPTQSDAIEGIQQFAQQSDLEFCTFKRDVKDAVLRSNFNSVPVPFSIHQLPTTVQAVDYDMGANEIAYNDNVFQSIGQGSNFTNYNNGWAYRNDGVDIETWTGSPTVGGMEIDEWLQYTVQVPNSGQYEVLLEYSAPNDGAQVELYSNDSIIIPDAYLSSTGGWGSWQWSVLGTITVFAQPECKIKLKIKESGLNIKSLKFDYKGGLNLLSLTNPETLMYLVNDQLIIVSTSAIQRLEVFDNMGKLLLEEIINNNHTLQMQIPFGYSKGVYFVRVRQEDREYSKIMYRN